MGSKNEKQKKKYKSSDPPPPAHDRANHEAAGKIITDSRFASAHSDPRFQKVPKHKSKVAIDSRFDRMFSDKSFKTSSARLDKRGKPKKLNSENPLRHYYRIEESKEEKERGRKESDTEADDDEDEEEEERELGKLDLGDKSEESVEEMKSEESESTTDTDEEEDVVDYEEEENEAKENIPVTEKETRRLAIVNMDWRHVKAVDLYVVLSSFLPKDGQILSIAVYPSEFGLQRMKEEEVRGPIGLFDDENDEGSDDDNDEIDTEKLRAYEKSRLRYYYAVMECDSIATADYLYKTCDGVEFERSSNVLDLRFIPDSMEFKHPPRDVATEAPANYEGLNFQSRALQQSKIHLTWDEDEPDRVKTLKRKFNADQLAELELKEFLASDGSESDDDQKRDKYRALVESGDGSDRDGEDEGQDMEVTFNTGLEDISKRILEKKDKISETVWEAYLRKKREKKKARKNKSQSSDDESSDTDQEAIKEPDDFFVEEPSVKKGKEARDKNGKGKQHQDADQEAEASRAELELLLADDNGEDTGLKGYNMKPKKVKGKKRKEVQNEDKIPAADYDDQRFSALFTSHLYALDPTEPQFKRSAAYARQVAQKQQKGDQQEFMERKHMKLPMKAQLPSDEPETNKAELAKSNKEKYELSSLVRSIKMKSKQVQKLPSEGKMSKKKR